MWKGPSWRGFMIKIEDFLEKELHIKIDRCIGSKHPNWGYIYPINYGYVPGTQALDGDEIDAYLLGIFEPVKEFIGTCIAIIRRVNDNEDKLIIVPKGKNYTDEQILALTEFQERFFKSYIVRQNAD